LKDALRDGDPIRAVIRETGTNQDGKTPTITSPSQEAQEALIRECYRQAGLDPINTSYIEAHGTGTPTGDPIEGRALAAAFKSRKRPHNKPLLVGSVKANIGHLESSSGLAGIIKAVLALEKGYIPPGFNFEKPNPDLPMDDLGIKIPTRLEPWPVGQLRRASVNNFGYGGSNTHVILDDALYHKPELLRASIGHSNGAGSAERRYIIPLSARDEGVVRTMTSNLKDYLSENSRISLEDLAYTLGQRRSVFPWASAVSATSISELTAALGDPLRKPIYCSGGQPRLGFVFNGQGAQWHAMGRELIAAYPVFEDSLREADSILKRLGAPWSLVEELMRDAKTTRVNDSMLSQPLCCALQMSLVRLLKSWGIKPTGVTGHSSGEIGAAFAAGAIDFADGLAIVYFRGALTKSYQEKLELSGGMLAVGLGMADIVPYISELSEGAAVVACVNSPSSVTVSGDRVAIDEVESRLVGNSIFARKLRVETAYHSHHMVPAAKEYLASLKKELKQEGDFGGVLFSSSVTGEWIESAAELTPDYWVKNMVQPVLFAQSLNTMCIGLGPELKDKKQFVDVLVEVGAHGALAGPIRQTLVASELKSLGITYGSCLTRGQSAVQTMQDLACFLWDRGYPVDMKAVNFPLGDDGRSVVHDLPSYPWSHSVRHWSEPRLNKEHRNRKHSRNDLLGSFVVGSNPLIPTWRLIIRASDLPWIRDHLIQETMIYPGAGYISTAIEAMHQLSKSHERPLAGYRLRDIDILKALVIPDGKEGIEVQICLRECNEKSLEQDWFEFVIHSTNDDIWIEHCKGFISPQFQSTDEDLSSSWSRLPTKPSLKKKYDKDSALYPKQLQTSDIFRYLHSLGVAHGPAFQNLNTIKIGPNSSVTTFSIADTASIMPLKYQTEHIIHPITLDSLFQTPYATLLGNGIRSPTAMIPKFIKSMFVSGQVSNTASLSLQAFTNLQNYSSQGVETSISCFHESDSTGVPVVELTGVYFQSLGSAGIENKVSADSKLCYTTLWEHDLTLMSTAHLKEHLKFAPIRSEVAMIQDLTRVTYHFVHDTLAALDREGIQDMDKHHQLLYEWMKYFDELGSSNALAAKSSKWATTSAGMKEKLLDKVASQSVNGKMLVRVGTNLLSIFRKEQDPLDLMLEKKLLYAYYEEASRYERSHAQVAKLLKLFSHKHPRAKILEIGGGRGACTGPILDALSGDYSGLGPQFAHYDFTDISSDFIEVAKSKFGAWGDQIGFHKLDVESNPVAQGFEAGSYDIVIACQVLHAAKNMEKAMTHVRQMLKPNGTIVIVETTQDVPDLQLIFGTTPGWWLSEELGREHNPSLSLNSWDRVLKASGFNGLEFQIGDIEDEKACSSTVLMSTATTDIPLSFHPEMVIVYDGAKPPQLWLDHLTSSIANLTSFTPSVERLREAKSGNRVVIVIDDGEQSIFHDSSPNAFAAIKNLLTNAKGIFWITRGGALNCERPEFALHTGLLRTLRVEDTVKRYISLDVDPKTGPFSLSVVPAITDIFKCTFNYALNKSLIDFEYAERGGYIEIPRIHEDSTENAAITPNSDHAVPEMEPFVQPNRELRMEVGTVGALDTLQFKDEPCVKEPLPADFVEIRPKAIGLNFKDIMVAMGQLDENFMGLECSGIVTKVGSNCSDSLRVGDRVCSLIRGHWASLIRVHWTSVVRIPDSMDFETAASIPLVFVTAYFSLYDVAHLAKGETVLIQAGTGGVGQAAIILAQLVDAEIFVTVSTEEKRDFIMNTYGVAADHIFSSRDPSFGSGIMTMTHGAGVDVVLNSLAGPLLQETWRCLATLGRFVEIGKRDMVLNKNLEMGYFKEATSFSAIDIVKLGHHKGSVVQRILSDVIRLIGENTIPIVKPLTVVPISEVQKAFRLMQAGKHLGKIVVKPNDGNLVSVSERLRHNDGL
jgi:acyl transferase domain-containing protein/NADPH:quinone reductase-like Zn-dependent oxidoreductase/ubiquinone/menaquinone biosynthesis C-methylase UbiE